MGDRECGKTETGRYLERTYGYKPVSFAGPLKDIVALLFGLDRQMLEAETAQHRFEREQRLPEWTRIIYKRCMDQNRAGMAVNLALHDVVLSPTGITPVKLLEIIGTDVFRDSFYNSIWIDVALMAAGKHDGPVVFTDCRFPDEYEALRQAGAKFVHIKRTSDAAEPKWMAQAREALEKGPESIEWRRMESKMHTSRWAWLKCAENADYVVENTGTLNELHVMVDKIAREMAE